MKAESRGGRLLRSHYLWASVVYVVLTIIFTWPLAANFLSFANGNIQDIFHELWYLRLGSTAPFGPFFLFSTNTILYPTGAPLYFQVTSPFNTLIFAALSPFFGEIASYNYLYMLTFFLSALFMYVFALYLTKNKYAAFLAGVIFGFAPIHIAQGLGHLNIMSAEFIPLFGYFLMKLVKEVDRRTTNAIYLAIAMALNAMCDLHMLLMVLTLSASFLIYYFLFQARSIFNKSFISRFSLAFVIGGLFTFLIYFQTIYGLLFAHQSAVAATPPFNSHYSADLLAFFLPPPSSPVLGQYTAPIYRNFLGNPLSIVYVGWTAILLAIVGIVAFRKSKEVLLWLFVALVGFLISLGPYIVVNGSVTPIPGIWQWFYFLVPFFKSFRTPYRFDYLIMLAVAVLSSYGVTAIMDRAQKDERTFGVTSMRVLKAGIAIIFCFLLIIEFITIPFPMTYLGIPKGYQILASDHSNYVVLEVPLNFSVQEYLYYQSLYSQPLVNGQVSRTPQSSKSFAQTTPFIDQLGQRFPGKAPPDIINQSQVTALKIAPYILTQYNIKYIIVHKDLLTSTHYSSIYNLVSNVTGPPIYQDNLMTIFEVHTPAGGGGIMSLLNSDSHLSTYSLLYGGWYQYGRFGAGSRSMDYSAGLTVFSKSVRSAQVQFGARGVTGNYTIEISVNQKVIDSVYVTSKNYTLFSTPSFNLNQGENQVLFYSTGGCKGIPVTNSGGIAVPGTPCVSVQFSSISVT